MTYINRETIDKNRRRGMDYTGFCNQVNKLSQSQYLMSNSLEIDCMSEVQEIRRDIEIEDVKYTTIWGQVKNHCNQPVIGEDVRLVKIHQGECGEYLEILNRTITDEQGCYTLEFYVRENEKYAILADSNDIKPNWVENNIQPIEVETRKCGRGMPRSESKEYSIQGILPRMPSSPNRPSSPYTIIEYNKHKCISPYVKSSNHF